MSRRGSPIHLLPEIVRTLFGPRATVRFPFAPPALAQASRGRAVVDAELCIGCGQCVRDCPAFALELERKGRRRFRLVHYEDRCAYCGQCVDSCRPGAIALVSEYPRASCCRTAFARVLVEVGED